MINHGNYEGAVEVLKAAVRKESKDDPEAWYQLGAAYTGLRDLKEARKAFERALNLRPDFARAHAGLAAAFLDAGKLSDAEHHSRRALGLDPRQKEAHYVLGSVALRRERFGEALERAEEALRTDPNFTPGLLLKAQALISQSAPNGPARPDAEPETAERKARLAEAEATLDRLVRLNPDAKLAADWREQLEAVRLYAKVYDPADPSRTIFRSNEVTTRAVIHSKPEPQFPESARGRGTHGTVRLRLVLGADGKVQHILVLRALPDGLTEASISAARKIRFTPATRDGRPVSTAVVVEYGFQIY
jgi:TonB family protein